MGSVIQPTFASDASAAVTMNLGSVEAAAHFGAANKSSASKKYTGDILSTPDTSKAKKFPQPSENKGIACAA